MDVIVNATTQAQWIKAKVAEINERGLDGITLDIELSVSADNKPLVDMVTQFCATVTNLVKKANPYAQVTIDVAYAIHCKYCDRQYDYLAISKIVDYVVIMDYDMGSPLFPPCTANPNSPAKSVASGLQDYLKIGIPPSKLICTFPWYGYHYPYCIEPVDVPICSLAWDSKGNCVGSHILTPYYLIETLIKRSTSGRQWDKQDLSPYFNFFDEFSQRHQLRYDDPKSISDKVAIAKMAGLQGVGMYSIDYVDYTNSSQVTQMWEAIESFFK